MSSGMGVTGAWRIVEMDLWDAEAIDLLGPGFIEFGGDRGGSFRFIAVEGWMDCHGGHRDERPCVEFTWEGSDECDPASGRGWAALASQVRARLDKVSAAGPKTHSERDPARRRLAEVPRTLYRQQGDLPPSSIEVRSAHEAATAAARVGRRDRLGGLIHQYHLVAA